MSPLPDVTIGSEEPLYNIGVVSRMTGISMATLRAWERRYDFPSARRTMGGHRLYSEKDIMQLRWVRDAGSQISLQLAFLLPGRQSEHAVPLRILRRLLGWGGMSRLMLRLREELGLTYAVDADLGEVTRVGLHGQRCRPEHDAGPGPEAAASDVEPVEGERLAGRQPVLVESSHRHPQ